MKTKAEATEIAKMMRNEMESQFPGTTWNIDVWENMGWHSKVHCGTIGVYHHSYPAHGHESYSISCGSEIGNTSATPMEWSLGESANTIDEVKVLVWKQIEKVKKDIEKREEILKHNQNCLVLS